MHDRLDGGGLDGLHADDRLDQELLAGRPPVELFFDTLAQERTDQGGNDQIKRQRDEGDQGQGGRIGKQHAHKNDGKTQVDDGKQALAGEEVSDGLEFAHSRNSLSCSPRLKIAEWQPHEVMEQAGAEFDVDAVGGMGERVGPQILQHDVEEAETDQADDDNVERRCSFMGQHLVDDHLEEQWRHQPEKLHKQRGDQDVTDRLAVSPDRGEEPFEAKRAGISPNAGTPGNEDDVPRPLGGKLSTVDDTGRLSDGIDYAAGSGRIDIGQHAGEKPDVKRGGDAR